jgi:hypothetical protein
LEALRDQKADQAAALLTPELSKLLTLRGQPYGSTVSELGKEYPAVDRGRPIITAEEMAPSRDEVRFRGTLEGEGESRDFTLGVVREKDSGKWRVAFYRVGESK